MQYKVLSASALLAATASAAITSYEIDTVTEHHTVDVTITSCSNNACETTVQKQVPTTLVTTVDGVKTVYTTYCPLTASSTSSLAPVSTKTAASTTSVVTTTVSGVETIYTTICPLTETTAATSSVKPATTSAVPATPATSSVKPATLVSSAPAVSPGTHAVAPTSSESDIYVDVTTTPTVTASTGVQATVTKQSTLFSYYSSSAHANSSAIAGVSTFAGNAAHNGAYLGGAAVGMAAVLLL